MSIKDETGKRTAKMISLLAMSLVLLFSPLIAAVQAVSGVTGVVTDTSGAIVPGVQVTLADTKTSREQTTTTNDNGVYVFSNIQPGTGYRITFTRQGFQTTILNDIALGIGRTETHNAQLTAGDVSATVEVKTTTGEDTLNTTDASIGNVINERQLRDLPIQFRDNPAALLGLQPGVIGDNVGTGATNRVGSVTGSRTDQGNITVDGIDSNDQATGQAFVTIGNVPIDSVQEFRAVSTNPNASEGRSSGGQIQISTRSGTNDFHGSLREYYRDERTAANSFFNNRNGIERPQLRRHQFGGSISGPLPFFNFGEGGPLFRSGRDRLFFFFDYEGRRDDSQATQTITVPLQSFREGRIGYINNNPGCTTASRLDTTPNCISFLTPAQIQALDPRGVGVNQALLNFINARYPLPNDLSGGNGINTGLFRFNAPNTLTSNTYTTRVDGNITANQRMFARATITRYDATNALAIFPGDEDSERLIDNSYQLVFGHTWVATPSFTNQATIGYSRQVWDFPVPSSPAFPNIFDGGGVITSPFADISFQDRDIVVPTLRNDSTWTLGSHTLQFGGQFKPIRQKSTLISDFNTVSLGLAGALTSLNSTLRPSNILAGTPTAPITGATANFDAVFPFLLGRIGSVSTNFVYDTQGNVQPLGTGRKRDYVYNEYELYAQDSWRVRNDLTLNFQLRWHLYPAPYEKNGFQTSNSVDYEELIATRVANAAAGIAGPTAEPFLTYDLSGAGNDGRPFYETDWNNFAPRVSFAYNPSFKDGFLGAVFGDRKTVLRGGYSLVYDRVGGGLTFLSDQSSYLFDNAASRIFGSTTNPRNSLLNDPRFTGLTTLPVQTTAPTITRPFTPFVSGGTPSGLVDLQYNYAIARNFEIPYAHQWSFGVQREIPGNMILDVSYVGRAARKQFALADAVQVTNFKDPSSGQTLFDAFNAVQAQLQSGAAITRQPWIENQFNAALGPGTCVQSADPALNFNCTAFIAGALPTEFLRGSTAEVLYVMAANGFIRPNVGLGAQFAANVFATNLGETDYHGMLVSLQKRFSRGFQFDVNYTWSHAIDNYSNVTNTGTATIFDITDKSIGRGDSEFDIRHLVNVNGIWDLPIGRGRAYGGNMNKFLDAFVGGWTISGIFTARSGLPASAETGVLTLSLLNTNLPVLIGDPSTFAVDIRDDGTGIQYFVDPAAVQAALRYPRHGESGTRNIFRNEGFFRLDAALSKKFAMPWSENHRLTLRGEAYNLTNSNFFGIPNLTLGSSNFGRLTTSQSTARVMQFAIRYDF